MENSLSCRRWVTTNQEEFQHPASVKVNRRIDSAELARYESCMERKAACEEDTRATARQILCTEEQEQNREPVLYPTDSHVDEGAKCKPAWCRCLATGNPNCYEETREAKATNNLCYTKQIQNQMEPTPDSNKQKIYSSTYFLDHRDPDYNYIAAKSINKQKLDKEFLDYKAKADAADEKKAPKIVSAAPLSEERLNANCLGLYDPPEQRDLAWKPDERWWREETSDCVKNLMKKYIWTSTYREMNKDGAALPVTVRPIPQTSMEVPPGDPFKRKPEMVPHTLYDLRDVFETWDRPQIRPVARRCDTIYNRPCLDYDTYFKDHYLHREKFGHCPFETHVVPSAENIRLVKEDRLRIPYDRMIPGYMGYAMLEAPPICKVKKPIDPINPDAEISTYQLDYIRFPSEIYKKSVQDEAFKPLEFGTKNITGQPISGLSRIPLPAVSRLSLHLECNKSSCAFPKETCGEIINY